MSLKAGHLVVRILCLDGLQISLMTSTVQFQQNDKVADHYGCQGNEECDPDGVEMAEDECDGGGTRGRARGGDKTDLELQVDGWKESEKSAKLQDVTK